MATQNESKFGVLDRRFLSRSLGLLDPAAPLTVYETDKVKTALKLLKENKVGAVVVVNNNEEIIGMFTERDVVLKLVLTGVNVNETPISEVMTASPETAEMTTTLAYAFHMMSEGGYRHMPIIDEDRTPVGMISVKDLVDYIAKQLVTDLSDLSVNWDF